MDIKTHTIVRGQSMANASIVSQPNTRALVTRSNSLRKADSPPALRPNRLPPPLPEHDVVDSSVAPIGLSGPQMQMPSIPQQSQHSHHSHHNHNHNHTHHHLNHHNFNQYRNPSQPSVMPPLMPTHNPMSMLSTHGQQMPINLNLNLNQNQNQNFKNGFNSNVNNNLTNSNINNNNNNNTIWSNKAKFSILPHPQQPILPQHLMQNQSINNMSLHSYPSQALQASQQTQSQQPLKLGSHPSNQQQRAVTPVMTHSMPHLTLQHNQNLQISINDQQQQQPLHPQQQQLSVSMQMPSHSAQHLAPAQQQQQQQALNSQNNYPLPHSHSHTHQQPSHAPTIPQSLPMAAQQPSPHLSQQSQGPAIPQQSQQRLSHEQFRAALQIVVSPGDPRFGSNHYIYSHDSQSF